MDHVIVIFRKGPYGQINSLEGIRVAQGLLVLDVETEAVFIDDGVFNLIKDQNPDGIGHHSVIGALEAMHRYEIPIFACKDSLEERGIKLEDLDSKLDVKIISLVEFSDLLLQADAAIAL
ncbi:MAG: DsrE family protein [Candidatus Heimdallarchaeota archaeon]|nr:DsrE family protein [Candidatus Heimdallarchaeota archaeon]